MFLTAKEPQMLRKEMFVYGPEVPHVPAHLHFGRDMLTRMKRYGDQPALINADTGETVTFGELSQKTVDIALSLACIGVRKGDVVSICCEKRMEIMPTVLGVICAGGVYSPLDETYGAAPVSHRLKISKPKVVFMSPIAYDLHKQTFDSVGCVETYIVYGDDNKDGGVLYKNFLTETADVEEFIPTPVDGWKDLALIQFSSGTTGLPKGVPCTHLSLLVGTDSCANESFKLSSMLMTREWYCTYGQAIALSCLKKGTTCVFTPKTDEISFLQAIQEYKVKIMQTTPSFVNQLIRSATIDNYDVTSLKAILSASTPLMKEQIQGVKKRFQNLRHVYHLYGMTESISVCSDLFTTAKDGSVGTASFGFTIKVVDLATREPLGPYQRGEICIMSPSVMSGYIGVENTCYLDSAGFYKTGDVGYYDEDQYFYVVSRVKELIKYKDSSLAPAEFEAILMKDERVLEAGVTAEGGQVAALVVLQPHARATPDEILEYLHSQITYRIRLEGGVYFVKSLLRGAGDKLDRRALHALLIKQHEKKQTFS